MKRYRSAGCRLNNRSGRVRLTPGSCACPDPIWTGVLLLAPGLFAVAFPAFADLTLVEDGKPGSVIVAPSPLSDLQRVAIADFRQTIRRSTGADLEVHTEAEARALPASLTRIVLGPSPLAEELGCRAENLRPEEFRVRTIGNAVVILASDVRAAPREQDSMVTTWALSFILEESLGVRWLWPGELGTVIPPRTTVRIAEMDVRHQPPLLRRSLNLRAVSTSDPDGSLVKLWAAHHQVAGQRITYRFGHSFRAGHANGDWWGRFHLERPELLAKDPDGRVACPDNRPDRVKLCISNPAVTEEILRLWSAAGQPDFWDVTPNDGNGFCTCDPCRSLDLEYGGVNYTPAEIWDRPPHVGLTDRYVWFWNQLVRRMRDSNPRARIGVYFYSAYRDPPGTLKLESGVVGEIVHGFDFGFWKAWQAAGAREIGLRPNWWHMGANAPHLPLHSVGEYLERARLNDLRWVKMDSLLEYWATQGPNYYLVARLISRPDLSTEDVIREYCDAFGGASSAVRRYLEFWEAYHGRVAYNIPAGGSLSQASDGLYETVCRREFGNVLHPLRGHWTTLPWIYPPDVLAQAGSILEEAREPAGETETRQRIDFLLDGLEQVRRTIAILTASPDERAARIRNLSDFAETARARYGYWGSSGLDMMRHWGVIGPEANLEGM